MINSERNPNAPFTTYRLVISILFFVAITAMVFILCISYFSKDDPSPTQFGLDQFTVMDSSWVDSDGNAFRIADIDAQRSGDQEFIALYHALPDSIDADRSLVFRSKNCTVSVLIDGETVYESDVRHSLFENHSIGTRWNIVHINSQNAGKQIELRVKQAYADGRAKVDTFFLGDRAAIVLHLINAKIGGLIISLLILFVAIIYLFTWVIFNHSRTQKDHSLFWLAILAILVAIWCLMETNVLQLFVTDPRLIQLTDNMMLVLGAMPMFLYLDSLFNVFRSRVVRILCALNMAYILLATLSQLLGFLDYHQTLNGAVAAYAFAVVLLIVCLFKQRGNFKTLSTRFERTLYQLQLLGLTLFGLGVLSDLIKYLSADLLDRACGTRIGLLCFVVCFGVGNLYQMIVLVKKGIEADFISRLAYTDGLTKVGNRTAYLEILQKWQTKHPSDNLCMVMFDINNLKEVNDTIGHKAGDELIHTSATLLTEAFPTPWHIYRIGGDEFIALSHTGNVRQAYRDALSRFTAALDQLNTDPDRTFPVSIAQGAAFTTAITADTILTAEKESDRNMYENKYRIKFQGLRP